MRQSYLRAVGTACLHELFHKNVTSPFIRKRENREKKHLNTIQHILCLSYHKMKTTIVSEIVLSALTVFDSCLLGGKNEIIPNCEFTNICICKSKKHNKAGCLMYTWIKKWTFFTTKGRKQKWHRTKSKTVGTKSN